MRCHTHGPPCNPPAAENLRPHSWRRKLRLQEIEQTPSRLLRDEAGQEEALSRGTSSNYSPSRAGGTGHTYPGPLQLHTWSWEGPIRLLQDRLERGLMGWLWGLHSHSLTDPRAQVFHLGTMPRSLQPQASPGVRQDSDEVS